MTRYTASDARREFFHLLDAVDRGELVILERRGIQYRIVREEPVAEPSAEHPLVIHDPSLLDGEWTWIFDDDGRLVLKLPGPDGPA